MKIKGRVKLGKLSIIYGTKSKLLFNRKRSRKEHRYTHRDRSVTGQTTPGTVSCVFQQQKKRSVTVRVGGKTGTGSRRVCRRFSEEQKLEKFKVLYFEKSMSRKKALSPRGYTYHRTHS